MQHAAPAAAGVQQLAQAPAHQRPSQGFLILRVQKLVAVAAAENQLMASE